VELKKMYIGNLTNRCFIPISLLVGTYNSMWCWVGTFLGL